MSDVYSTALPGELMYKREKIPLDMPPIVSCVVRDCFGGSMGGGCEWVRGVATRIG
jgi:hypothetical protein